MSLKSRILKASEFDADIHRDCCVDGARDENQRLQPLILALTEEVERKTEALEQAKKVIILLGRYHGDTIIGEQRVKSIEEDLAKSETEECLNKLGNK